MIENCLIKEVEIRSFYASNAMSVSLTCVTPRSRLIHTPFVFDKDAPRQSSHYQKWRLLQKIFEKTNRDDVMDLRGAYLRIQFEKWNDVWLITGVGRCEPFDEVTDEEKNANLEAEFKELENAVR